MHQVPAMAFAKLGCFLSRQAAWPFHCFGPRSWRIHAKCGSLLAETGPLLQSAGTVLMCLPMVSCSTWALLSSLTSLSSSRVPSSVPAPLADPCTSTACSRVACSPTSRRPHVRRGCKHTHLTSHPHIRQRRLKAVSHQSLQTLLHHTKSC